MTQITKDAEDLAEAVDAFINLDGCHYSYDRQKFGIIAEAALTAAEQRGFERGRAADMTVKEFLEKRGTLP